MKTNKPPHIVRYTDPEIDDFLARDDDGSRPFRLERMKFLLEEWGEPRDLLLPGGLIAAAAFDEARLCYLHGHFIGCIVLCQVVIEHVLAGEFKIIGRDDVERAGFQKLADEALAQGLISGEELDAFEVLRERRNPYTHPRALTDPGILFQRIVEHRKELDELSEDDARVAVRTMFRLLKRRPFGLPTD